MAVEYDAFVPAISGACPAGYVAHDTDAVCGADDVACWLADTVSCDAGYYVIDDDCGACPIGSYCLGGENATATPCPTTGMVDSAGNPVSATTVSTGATSMLECVVPSDVFFSDERGTYRYKTNCSYK